jgi:hypothetical protein
MTRRRHRIPEGKSVPKDKKKSKPDDKGKKAKKTGKAGAAAKTPRKVARKLQGLADNPLVADIVAAALVGMASALKDSDQARKLAGKAGDELGKMGKSSAKQGGAMWDLALKVGRDALAALADEARSGKRGKPR